MDVTYSMGAEVLALAPGPSRATSQEYQTHVLPMGSALCISYDVRVGPAGWNPYGLGRDPLCWGRLHRHCKLHR